MEEVDHAILLYMRPCYMIRNSLST